MARDQRPQARTLSYPGRLQDLGPLTRRVGEDLAPVIEEAASSAATAAVSERALLEGLELRVQAIEIRRRRSGTVVLEDTFTDAQVGGPVLCSQRAPARIGDAEAGIVLFVAVVEDPRRMRVAWFCAGDPPATAELVYIVG